MSTARLRLLIFDSQRRVDPTAKFLYTLICYDSKTYMHSRSVAKDDHAVAHKPRGLQNHTLDHAQFYIAYSVCQSSEAGYQKAALVSGFNKSGIASLLPGKSMLLEGLLMKRDA